MSKEKITGIAGGKTREGLSLRQAIRENNIPAVEALLEEHSIDLNNIAYVRENRDSIPINYITPLMLACQYEHQKMIKYLIEAGAETDKSLNKITTPLSPFYNEASCTLPISKILFNAGLKLKTGAVEEELGLEAIAIRAANRAIKKISELLREANKEEFLDFAELLGKKDLDETLEKAIKDEYEARELAELIPLQNTDHDSHRGMLIAMLVRSRHLKEGKVKIPEQLFFETLQYCYGTACFHTSEEHYKCFPALVNHDKDMELVKTKNMFHQKGLNKDIQIAGVKDEPRYLLGYEIGTTKILTVFTTEGMSEETIKEEFENIHHSNYCCQSSGIAVKELGEGKFEVSLGLRAYNRIASYTPPEISR